MTWTKEQHRNYMRDYMRKLRAGQRLSSGANSMRRRGRKPVDLGLLTCWEFEWYKAFHLLRDGTQLPPDPNFEVVNERETKAQLQWWKKASLKDILGDMAPGTPPPFDELPEAEREKAKLRWTMREWTWLKDHAEYQRQSQIAALERWLRPKETPARAERRKIWGTLTGCNTSATAIEQACAEWKRLPDVRAFGLTPFPDHVSANLEEFRRMKQHRRFPRSDSADDSRLEYLARGMAGLMAGKSPMTAIARLRNMSHKQGGPLRNEMEMRCHCWRCRRDAWCRLWEKLRAFQEGGTKP